MEDPILPEPANLRFLRRLVTLLTATMILGVLGIFVLLFLRLQAPSITLPEALTLPSGTVPAAYAQTPTVITVVTQDNRILVYDPTSLEIVDEIEITFGK